MKIGVPKEVHPGERRVAATPDTAKRLQKLGFEVAVQAGAGVEAGYSDELYREAGCEILPSAPTLYGAADVVLKVRPPEATGGPLGKHEVDMMREGATLVSFLWPAQNEALVEKLRARKITAFAMDAVPRITRAQKMDALSSMANLAGYRAVIEAAYAFPRFFTGQITAAGKVPPAKVLVIGAGVAGLAAIGAARGLGAIVRAFDTRPAVKEQVESMGAEFLELEFEEDGTGEGGYAKVMSKEFIDAEMALFREQAADVDIIITTALIPGKPAPRLITRDMVESMRPGSVIVDLAAERGGNCEVTKPDEIYAYQGVTLVGVTDMPSRMASVASQLYGMNLVHMMDEFGGAEGWNLDLDNQVIRGSIVCKDGELLWPPPKIEPSPQKKPEPKPAPAPAAAVAEPEPEGAKVPWSLIAAGLALVGVGLGAPASFLSHLTVFVLACFVGWQVIWNVTPALHTPLMSVTNAISGIIIIGGMLQISGPPTSWTTILGVAAILVATINIAGGFLVTQRMLQMFRK